MHDLTPLSALGDTTARIDTIGQIKIAEVTDVALASFTAPLGKKDSCSASLQLLLGTAPPEPGEATLSESISAIWTGPEQWMLMASHAEYEYLASYAAESIPDASITEQNDAWVCFDVSGPGFKDLFERLCAVPIRRLGTGSARRTTIHHLGCFLILTDADASARVLGPRSAAGSLHHALVTAAKSVS